MTGEHYSYPNPTIIEAVCELRFTSEALEKWESNYFSEFSDKIKESYPAFEPVQQHLAQFILSAQGVAAPPLQAEQRMKFKSKDGTRLIQLGPSSIAMFFLPKYPGWKLFHDEILFVWGKGVEVFGCNELSRIGLRYINRLPSLAKGTPLSNWLRSSEFIPKSVTGSKGSTFFRSETTEELGKQTVVTIGLQEDSLEGDKLTYIFDIDCSKTGEITSSCDYISNTISLLHDRAWEVFSSSKTSQLDDVLHSSSNIL